MATKKLAMAEAALVPGAAPQVPEGRPPEPSGASDELAMVLQAACRPEIDAAKVKALLEELARREDRSARRAFNRAIAAAKGEIGPIFKNQVVDYPHRDERGRTQYRHEDFAAVAKVVDPVLPAHGLSYRFRAHQENGRVRVTCIVSHADGCDEETTLEAVEDKSGQKNSIQAIGSTATYLQRYTLKLALGLAASDHDDDGKASGPPVLVTIDQAAHLQQLLRDTESDLTKFLAHMQAPSLAEFTIEQYKTGIALLEAKKRSLNEEAKKRTLSTEPKAS